MVQQGEPAREMLFHGPGGAQGLSSSRSSSPPPMSPLRAGPASTDHWTRREALDRITGLHDDQFTAEFRPNQLHKAIMQRHLLRANNKCRCGFAHELITREQDMPQVVISAGIRIHFSLRLGLNPD